MRSARWEEHSPMSASPISALPSESGKTWTASVPEVWRNEGGRAVTPSPPHPIYTGSEVLMKPGLVPHNRPPQARTYGNGAAKCGRLSRSIRREGGYERAWGGDRRRRAGGHDAGGRAGAGEGRRR